MSKSYNKYIYFLPDGFPAVKDALRWLAGCSGRRRRARSRILNLSVKREPESFLSEQLSIRGGRERERERERLVPPHKEGSRKEAKRNVLR